MTLPLPHKVTKPQGHTDKSEPIFGIALQAQTQTQTQTQLSTFRSSAEELGTATPPHRNMDSNQIQFLQKQGFPSGMIRSFPSQKPAFPLRVWIVDNSLYMNVRDAHIIRGNYQNFDATRWEELQDCVAYHANFAAMFALPVRFALINDPHIQGVPQYFTLNQTGNLPLEQQILRHVMTNTKPSGPTLLTNQILLLRDYISSIAPQLRANNQTVSVIIATQGLPTDENNASPPSVLRDFILALQNLEALPVWVVLRLCTDDEKAFEFFNAIDAELSLPFDVLDDFAGEAVEVYLRNPWLTYGMPLHRYREMGFRTMVLDQIDERALTPHEIRDLCMFLFSAPPTQYPDPVLDWHGFLQVVSQVMAREQVQWNPLTKSVAPWFNLTLLHSMYSEGAGATRNSTAGATPQQHQPPQQQGREFPAASQPQNVTPAPPPPPQNVSLAPPPAVPMVTKIHDPAKLKQYITTTWAKQPPRYDSNKPIRELLATVDSTFPLVEPHEYFQEKFTPFSKEALSSGGEAVLKRGTLQMDRFVHLQANIVSMLQGT